MKKSKFKKGQQVIVEATSDQFISVGVKYYDSMMALSSGVNKVVNIYDNKKYVINQRYKCKFYLISCNKLENNYAIPEIFLHKWTKK